MHLVVLIDRYKNPLAICLLVKILLIVFSYFAFQFSAHQPITSLGQFLGIWNRWDAPHYLYLAEHGYTATPQTSIGENLFIVFLPFFPVLVKAFSLLTMGNFLLAGTTVSLTAAIFASICLYEIVKLDYGEKAALRGVLFLNIFPTSYFMLSSYTESMFLALSLAFYLAMRKQLLIPSILLGFAAGLTRLNALLLIILTLGRKKLRSKFYALSIISGFAVYLLLNYSTFGNPFYFLSVLHDHWYKSFSYPWIGIKNSIFYALQQKGWVEQITFLQEPIYLVLILLLGIYAFFRLNKVWGSFMIASFLLFSSTSFILSTPRYSLVLFPIYIILAKWSRRRIFLISYTFICVAFLLFFTARFVQGKWAF